VQEKHEVTPTVKLRPWRSRPVTATVSAIVVEALILWAAYPDYLTVQTFTFANLAIFLGILDLSRSKKSESRYQRYAQIVSRGAVLIALLTFAILFWTDVSQTQRIEQDVSEIARTDDLSGRNLSALELARIDLQGKNLSRANLRASNLTQANLNFANLSGADLRDTDFTEASLQSADLSDSDLSRAILRGADLSGADLVGARVSQTSFVDATADSSTKWPQGFDWRGAGVIIR
jgi:uncharacterized protein YjbI with pentapeptide repeats